MKKSIKIVILMVVLLVSGCASGSSLTNEQMEKVFIEDYELLRTVAEYFANSRHTMIHIWRTTWRTTEEGYMRASNRTVAIRDETVVAAIEALMARGYSLMRKTDNIIYFQRATRGRHFGSGFTYSIDGVEPNYGVDPTNPLYGSATMPTQIMFLTKLEPLSKPNWFYYEEDFREWRVRYQ